MSEDPSRLAARRYEFRSDDLDEVVGFCLRNFGPHSRVPWQRRPLGYHVAASIAARSAAGVTSLAIPSTVRAATRLVTVHLPLHRGCDYRIGRRTLVSAPAAAVLLPPGHDYSVDSMPGQALAIMLEPSMLERAIDATLARRPRTWALRSMRLPLVGQQLTELRRLIRQHDDAVHHAQRAGGGADVRAVEERMASWLAGRIVDASGLAGLSTSSRQAVEKVDGWIRRHASQPISLDRLGAVAGVSGRTLQEACMARWGQSPMELVAARRLEVVRTILLSGRAPTVTDAAAQGGFAHLGRFSISYRRAFGESPSDTLARRRPRP